MKTKPTSMLHEDMFDSTGVEFQTPSRTESSWVGILTSCLVSLLAVAIVYILFLKLM